MNALFYQRLGDQENLEPNLDKGLDETPTVSFVFRLCGRNFGRCVCEFVSKFSQILSVFTW